jgi:YVTN family beta-propeller protein
MKLESKSYSEKPGIRHSFSSKLLLAVGCVVLAVSPAGAVPYLFVNMSASDEVVAINSSTGAQTHISVGDGPNRIAMTPNATKAYVTNGMENTVSVIDTVNRVELYKRTVADSPGELAISPDGQRVYVVHQTNGSLKAINTLDDSLAFTSNLGGTQCKDVLVGTNLQANSYIYVANYSTGKVNIVDSSGGAVANITTAGGPRRLAITPDGAYVLATDNSSNKVTIIRTSDHSFYKDVVVGNAPRGIAVTPDGAKTYVTNMNDGTVSVIDNTTDFTVDPVPITVEKQPWQVIISPSQNYACVSNSQSDSVTIISTLNDQIVHTFTKAEGIGDGPFQSTLGPGGHALYVADSMTGTDGTGIVSVINLDNLVVLPAITISGGKPFDVAFNVPQ